MYKRQIYDSSTLIVKQVDTSQLKCVITDHMKVKLIPWLTQLHKTVKLKKLCEIRRTTKITSF